MVTNVSVQHNEGFLPGINYTVDPTLLPSGNPFKCHVEVLYLQPMIPPIGAWVNSKMSGRNQSLYCTITLIAMQGRQTNAKTKGTISLDTTQFVTLGLGSDGCR